MTCGGCLFAVSPTSSGADPAIANGRSVLASLVSVVVDALRTHTPTLSPAFALAGCQVNVRLSLQSCTIVHTAPSKTHHLYWYDPSPPIAVAVNVIGVPAACGAGRFAVSPTWSPLIGGPTVPPSRTCACASSPCSHRVRPG